MAGSSDSLEMAGVEIAVAKLSERLKALQADVTEERLAIADVRASVVGVEARLRRIELVGLAIAASGVLGGGSALSMMMGLFNGA